MQGTNLRAPIMKHVTNLLVETKQALSAHGYSHTDVDWVGASNGSKTCDWKKFATIADKIFDPGYGSNEVSTSLVIVLFDGAWFERHEYDGSEWWDFKTTPTAKSDASNVTDVFINQHYTDPLL